MKHRVTRVAIIRMQAGALYNYTNTLVLGSFTHSLVQLRRDAMPKCAYKGPKESILVDSSIIKSVSYEIGGVPHDLIFPPPK